MKLARNTWIAVMTLATAASLVPAQPPTGGGPVRGSGVAPVERTRSAVQQLALDIDAIIADAAFADATWGVSVVSCETGESLYRWNERQNRQVASDIKLLTTAAALRRLGGEYRFSTEVYLAPTLSAPADGERDLLIRTLGDPSISPAFGRNPADLIARWVKVLDSLGVRMVDDVVVDASAFDDVPYGPGWAWDDEPFGFAAPISAAAIYDNAVSVTVTPGRAPGRSVLIDISPPTAYVTLQVTAVTSRPDSTSSLDIRRGRGESTIEVAGNIAAGSEPYTELISIEEPPVYFATLVAEELQRHGIVVRGAAIDAAERPRAIDYRRLRPIAVSYSPPLREILAVINKQSHNLAAEMVAKKLGREFGGAGTTAAGVEVIRGFLASAGVDIERTRIYDGSGLARHSMVAPADIVQLLRWLRRNPIGEAFASTLSVAGRDGTLAKRLKGTLAEGSVLAKTGYLTGVRAVSGYVRTRDGEWLAFSLVANNYTVPTSVVNNAQDLIMMRLASFSRNG